MKRGKGSSLWETVVRSRRRRQASAASISGSAVVRKGAERTSSSGAAGLLLAAQSGDSVAARQCGGTVGITRRSHRCCRLSWMKSEGAPSPAARRAARSAGARLGAPRDLLEPLGKIYGYTVVVTNKRWRAGTVVRFDESRGTEERVFGGLTARCEAASSSRPGFPSGCATDVARRAVHRFPTSVPPPRGSCPL